MIKSKFYQIIAGFIAALFLASAGAYAQDVNEGEITEGTEYWFAIPHAWMTKKEYYRYQYPIMIWISSKVDTRATIEAESAGLLKTVNITKNKTKIVPVGDFLMCTNGEVVEDKGIHISSEDPISVSIYMSYRWTGEAFRVIPVEWLGKKYFSSNLYLDADMEKKPPQILIVATEDKTRVTYTPTAPTQLVDKGKTRSILMNKGDTYLIQGRIQGYENMWQDWITDITGTYIEADKPIAVLSGHTKGAFPYFIDYIGWAESHSYFMKNMLMEMLWPVELLGDEYVSAPIYYLDRSRDIHQDDRGDLVRIIATEDDTDIYIKTSGADEPKLMRAGLKKGEWYNFANQEEPAVYSTNDKPVLVTQYGKSWWSQVVPETQKDQDSPQNPPRNGQGMLLVLAPQNHWTSHANFYSPTDIDNFVYITFLFEDRQYLKFDGQNLIARFGSKVQRIEGTPYAYVTEQIGPGDHWISADSGATFAGYAYGNWDYCKDGHAYGYPVGINYATPCEDSLAMEDEIECGNVTGTAYSLPEESECAFLFSVRSKDLENYIFEVEEFEKGVDKEAKFTFTVIDPRKPAKGTVIIMAKSGKSISKTYEYIPAEIETDPTSTNFGQLEVGEKVCKNFKIINPGTVPLLVNDLRLKDNKVEFEVKKDQLPVEIAPGEFVMIEACATAKEISAYPVIDSVIAELECFEETIEELIFTTVEPVVFIYDAEWRNIPVGHEVEKSVNIENRSNVEIIVQSYAWDDKLHFTRTDLDARLPLSVPAHGTVPFKVWYMPDRANDFNTDPDIDTAHFVVETSAGKTVVKDKLFSEWIGNGIDAGPGIEGYDWFKRRVIDKWSTDNGVNEYQGTVVIKNTSDNAALDVVDVVIENDPDGVFRLDKSTLPKRLNALQEYTITAYFAPKAEKEYTSEVKFISEFEGDERPISGTLHGIGILPHIKFVDVEFDELLAKEETQEKNGPVISYYNNIENAMNLTIEDLYIDGPDAAAFRIVTDNFTIPTEQNPEVRPANENEPLFVPIEFAPQRSGDFTAYLRAKSDCYYDDDGDDPDVNERIRHGVLTGKAYLVGIEPTDYDFGRIFLHTSKDGGVVTLTNLGSKAVTIERDIAQSIKGKDAMNNSFRVKRWYTSVSGDNPQAPFDIEPKDVLTVEVTFHPNEDFEMGGVRDYEAYIEYETTNETAVSNLYGSTKMMETSFKIGKYGIDDAIAPGEKVEIDVVIPEQSSYLYTPDGMEEHNLSEANITKYVVRVKFREGGVSPEVQEVYPDAQTVTTSSLNSTLSEGFDVEAKVVDASYLECVFTAKAGKNLSGQEGLLFDFVMDTYLSDLDDIPLPVEFIAYEEDAEKYIDGNVPEEKPYLIIHEIPGSIKIDPVCVNNIRLVTVGPEYMFDDVYPNPVENAANLGFQIAFKARTTIKIFNSAGDLVATALDDELKAGRHEYTLDVGELGLGTGAYRLQFESGVYKVNKPLIIVK